MNVHQERITVIQMLHAQILQAHSPVHAMLVIPDLVQHVQVCHSNGCFYVAGSEQSLK